MTVFSSIRELFRRTSWSRAQSGRVGEMLDTCVAMNKFVYKVLMEGHSDRKAQAKLYERDQRVNDLEREVRRGVLTHLALEDGSEDVPASMVFLNAVKDAERIGDYLKNLYDVTTQLMPDEPDRDLYRHWLREPADALRDLMKETAEVFRTGDDERAKELAEAAREQGRTMEEAIVKITRGGLSVEDAVCLALIHRFYKRIFMHLSNIASTLCVPVDRMDFFDERGDPRGDD